MSPIFILAKVFFTQDKYGASGNALRAAKALAKTPDDKRRYQAKLFCMLSL
jgi:hypothetical protein